MKSSGFSLLHLRLQPPSTAFSSRMRQPTATATSFCCRQQSLLPPTASLSRVLLDGESMVSIKTDPRAVAATLDAPGVRDKAIPMPPQYSLTDTVHSIITTYHNTKDPFYVLDLGTVSSLMHNWTRKLPQVQPFFAVKCNPSPCFLGALASLGANFDCATQAEIESVLALGVSPDRIIYANPCKPESHIRYAATVGVNITTFDSVDEVHKIQKWHPNCNLVIRIKAPDEEGARFKLGSKYGAFPEEIVPLLKAAQAAQLSVIGVSFHVGCETKNCSSYGKAIAAARSVFDTALMLGMPPMYVLNIGGGFFSRPASLFDDVSSAVNDAIKTHFPNEATLQVIAEPGRYFAVSTFKLVANVIGKRVRRGVREYWINDGVYGSMNLWLCDFTSLTCLPLAYSSNNANPMCVGLSTFTSTVFGPTCDSGDVVLTDYQLPELEVDDWVMFPNMGAYTAASIGCDFNGCKGSNIPTYVIYTCLN